MNRFLLFLLIGHCSISPAFGGSERSFLKDLETFCKGGHRLSGTAESHAAAAHIRQKIGEIGVDSVYDLEMPVWQTHVETCRMVVGGKAVQLLPMRPNLVAPPVTSEEGVTGPFLYVGRGELADYGTRSASGAIVVLDYIAHDGWKLAFAMGAKAVVFLGDDHSSPASPRRYGLPANYLRFYAPPEAQSILNLRQDYPSASLVSHIPWRVSSGLNVLAFLRGTDPVFDRARGEETIVVSCNYDTLGEVPNASPGARNAANVAALLESIEYLKANRPRRNFLFMFLDNQARYHQGAREVYYSLMGKKGEAADVALDHEEEMAFVDRLINVLRSEQLRFSEDQAIRLQALQILKRQAEYIATELKQRLLRIRVEEARTDEALVIDELRREKADVAAQLTKWDNARRALHQNTPELIDAGIYSTLRMKTLEKSLQRKAELERLLRIDRQRASIRQDLGNQWISLHVAFNFSGLGPSWGLVIGDNTNAELYGAGASSDKPGYYGRVLAAFREIGGPAAETLSDPLQSSLYAPGGYISSGHVAGIFGVYNISLMTGYDARARDGHPSDSIENLNWKAIRAYATAANITLARVSSSAALSLPRTFANTSMSDLPRWGGGRPSGNYAASMASGSVAEDQPASGAMMALWGYYPPRVWEVQRSLSMLPFFDRMLLEPVDMNGRFGFAGVSRELFRQYVTLGASFGRHGDVNSISAQDTLFTETAGVISRVNLFPATGFGAPYTLVSDIRNVPLRVLEAASDAEPLASRSLTGQIDEGCFFYLFKQAAIERVKVFQAKGVALMNATPEHPAGVGYPAKELKTPPPVNAFTAPDLWRLNESRLGILRSRGVNNTELELLHGSARRALEKAETESSTERKTALLGQSTQLSRRVYPELRGAMDDLVHAVVLLLLLTLPFSFAVERLLFCASTVYGRIGGFAAVFAVTFGLLYFMHPGFAVATTPMIIFMAFTIMLLSSVVIFIVVRKFNDELKATQGRASVHSLQVSRMGTMMAAVSMGISTMRRRPTRTLLTTITVVLLTFTILCFASFSAGMGLNIVFEGTAGESTQADVYIRQLDYKPIPPSMIDVIRGMEGQGGVLCTQWWLSRLRSEDPAFTITRVDGGEVISFDCVMGFAPEELLKWPELDKALEGEAPAAKDSALRGDGVYLPTAARDRLGLKIGDPVLLNGRQMVFAGVFRGNELQRLKHLDGRSVLPVDFVSAAAQAPGASQESEALSAASQDLSQRDFIRLNPDQIAIVGNDAVKEMRGALHVATLYMADRSATAAQGKRLAEVLPLPVWVRNREQVDRMIFARITTLKGGGVLLVPVLLGGLIIFGTLLGSISDREKEIYTFSALGLAPAHVGFLFFSEAAVYAVVGGMGGQILTQAVALVTAAFARAGYIQAPELNYSSGNAIFANIIVMLTVLVSAAYPAYRASRSANPGVQRAWKLPSPVEDELKMVFPFTVSAYDITGVISFLAEHFRAYEDAGLGKFAASDVEIGRNPATGYLVLRSHLALAPFDLGVTQDFVLTAVPSEIPGVDEIVIRCVRCSGGRHDWVRSNREFIQDLRRQFLLWRTLSSDVIESYRLQTLQVLEERNAVRETVEVHA